MNTLLKHSTFFLLLLLGLVSCGVEEDACLTLDCVNGGTCISGGCACPDGYEGEDCSIELEPVSMSIIGINVTEYPLYPLDSMGQPDSTKSWDTDGTGPDLFFAFHEGTSSNYDPNTDFVSSVMSNATGNPLEINATPPYVVTNLTSNWSLDLWDADGATQEFMDGVIFVPATKAPGLPTTFEVKYPNMKATFFVQWEF